LVFSLLNITYHQQKTLYHSVGDFFIRYYFNWWI
jgi:hypothetical protein